MWHIPSSYPSHRITSCPVNSQTPTTLSEVPRVLCVSVCLSVCCWMGAVALRDRLCWALHLFKHVFLYHQLCALGSAFPTYIEAWEFRSLFYFRNRQTEENTYVHFKCTHLSLGNIWVFTYPWATNSESILQPRPPSPLKEAFLKLP